MENSNPFIEPILFFGLGLVITFVIIPVYIILSTSDRRR